jgi:hypothetical protein
MTDSRRALSTVLAALLLVAPVQAVAQSAQPSKEAVEEASTRYKRGVAFVKEENYRGALTEFRRAYELTRDFHVLYNVAQMCSFLQDYVCAGDTYDSYLKQGGDKVEKERRTEVETAMREMKGRIATATITTSVPEVDISVDDQPRGKTPLEAPVRLSAGQHRLSAVRAGYIPITRTFDVAGGDTPTIALELVPSQQQVVVQNQGPTEQPSRFTTLSWVGIGAAGAMAIGAGVTGVLALSASNDLKTTQFPDATSQANKVKTLRTVSDVLSVVAIGTLTTTLVLTLTRNPQAETAPAPASTPENTTARAPHVDVAVGFGSAALIGTF